MHPAVDNRVGDAAVLTDDRVYLYNGIVDDGVFPDQPANRGISFHFHSLFD